MFSFAADRIIKEVADFIKDKNSAFEAIKDKVEFQPIPPYFKLGKLMLHDEIKQEIHIKVNENMPVANCGDGVSVNQKAARILSELFGFDSPGTDPPCLIPILKSFSGTCVEK